jgi:hypothetical protein
MWQPQSVRFNYTGKVMGFVFNGYYEAIYANYRINPAFDRKFFNNQVMEIPKTAFRKDSAYWDNNRPVPLTRQEEIYYYNKDSISTRQKKLTTRFYLYPGLLTVTPLKAETPKDGIISNRPKMLFFLIPLKVGALTLRRAINSLDLTVKRSKSGRPCVTVSGRNY